MPVWSGLATPVLTFLLQRPSKTLPLKGQVEEGLQLLAEGFATADKNSEHVYEAELYRLKGQLTLQKFQVSSSEL